jgi:hypothetical protein
MIEGLKCTVPGYDVIKFAKERSVYHRERAAHYRHQVDVLVSAGIENTNVSNDPKAGAISKEKEHITAADELDFMVEYFVPAETYNLSLADLQKLGKVSRGW